MSQTNDNARDRFLALLRDSVRNGTLEKLTLGKPCGDDPALRNLFIRPIVLKAGPRLAFVWRYATRDITKNLTVDDAFAQIGSLIGADFLDAHLFTTAQTAQLECAPGSRDRLAVHAVHSTAKQAKTATAHDRPKSYLIPPDSPWLRALGIANDRGQPRAEMTAKFRQIQKFADLLQHLLDEAEFGALGNPIRIVDMGSGKGYLTFATAALLGSRATVTGIEARPELATLCNDTAREQGFTNLRFSAGTVADTPLEGIDVLIALHACDTATDDALARGIAANARLLLVAPCCQKELRPQLTAPAVLAGALRHGIFQERQAEFVTDALRAQLLEWAGYRTKAFEFIST